MATTVTAGSQTITDAADSPSPPRPPLPSATAASSSSSSSPSRSGMMVLESIHHQPQSVSSKMETATSSSTAHQLYNKAIKPTSILHLQYRYPQNQPQRFNSLSIQEFDEDSDDDDSDYEEGFNGSSSGTMEHGLNGSGNSGTGPTDTTWANAYTSYTASHAHNGYATSSLNNNSINNPLTQDVRASSSTLQSTDDEDSYEKIPAPHLPPLTFSPSLSDDMEPSLKTMEQQHSMESPQLTKSAHSLHPTNNIATGQSHQQASRPLHHRPSHPSISLSGSPNTSQHPRTLTKAEIKQMHRASTMSQSSLLSSSGGLDVEDKFLTNIEQRLKLLAEIEKAREEAERERASQQNQTRRTSFLGNMLGQTTSPPTPPASPPNVNEGDRKDTPKRTANAAGPHSNSSNNTNNNQRDANAFSFISNLFTRTFGGASSSSSSSSNAPNILSSRSLSGPTLSRHSRSISISSTPSSPDILGPVPRHAQHPNSNSVSIAGSPRHAHAHYSHGNLHSKRASHSGFGGYANNLNVPTGRASITSWSPVTSSSISGGLGSNTSSGSTSPSLNGRTMPARSASASSSIGGGCGFAFGWTQTGMKVCDTGVDTRQRMREAWHLFEMGATEAAAATFARAVEVSGGDPFARYAWAMCLLHGSGIDRDVPRALSELHQSATDGEVLAMYDLGCFYRDFENGDGFHSHYLHDDVSSVASFGSNGGNGNSEMDGHFAVGVLKSEKTRQMAAMKWFLDGAELGHAESQIAAAECLLAGKSISKNDRLLAQKYLRMASEHEPQSLGLAAAMVGAGATTSPHGRK
ncbi:hypothetical protein HDU76_004425, partial [Blyttiomyces sp. JEL0837]